MEVTMEGVGYQEGGMKKRRGAHTPVWTMLYMYVCYVCLWVDKNGMNEIFQKISVPQKNFFLGKWNFLGVWGGGG